MVLGRRAQTFSLLRHPGPSPDSTRHEPGTANFIGRHSVRAVKEFAAHANSVGLARHFVAATLEAWDLDDLDEVACLLTSELAANAVVHAGTAFQVTVHLDPPELLVEVVDFAPSQSVRHEVSNDRRSGRGLVIVEALASRWGVRIQTEAKAVWFSLPVGGPKPSLT